MRGEGTIAPELKVAPLLKQRKKMKRKCMLVFFFFLSICFFGFLYREDDELVKLMIVRWELKGKRRTGDLEV